MSSNNLMTKIDSLHTEIRKIKVVYLDDSDVSEEYSINDAKVALSTNVNDLNKFKNSSIARIFFFVDKDDENSCFEFDLLNSFMMDDINNKFKFSKTIHPLKKTQEVSLYFEDDDNKLDFYLKCIYESLKNSM